MWKSLLTSCLPILAALTASCGGGGGVELTLKVDRSRCTSSCELVRFNLDLQRETTPGALCTMHRSSEVRSDLQLDFPDIEEGAQLTAVLTAYCRAGAPSEVESVDCCLPLGKCLPNSGTDNPDCIEAKSSCPAKTGGADPWVNAAGAETYFETWCTLREKCVQCSARRMFRVADGAAVPLELQSSAYCAGPSSVPACP